MCDGFCYSFIYFTKASHAKVEIVPYIPSSSQWPAFSVLCRSRRRCTLDRALFLKANHHHHRPRMCVWRRMCAACAVVVWCWCYANSFFHFLLVVAARPLRCFSGFLTRLCHLDFSASPLATGICENALSSRLCLLLVCPAFLLFELILILAGGSAGRRFGWLCASIHLRKNNQFNLVV